VRLYHLILAALSPAIAIRFLMRLATGKETREGLAQRLGYATQDLASSQTLWLHGASLGELIAARPFLDHLLHQNPQLRAVVTSNTYTARDMVKKWGSTRVHARLAPLDNPSSINRFLNAWHPRAAFTLENEIWPSRILACQKRAIPFIVLGGRISAKSAANWQRFSGLAQQVMGAISALAPMNSQHASRFASLGLPTCKIAAPVNLKAIVELPPPDPKQIAQFSKVFSRDTTLLAASTHAGEEETILAAFQIARAQIPDLRLILAPRHPERGAAVAQLIEQSGLSFAQRTKGQSASTTTDVYLADTTGEMPLWYALASLTFLGASLVDKGGHTPVEPVQFGSTVLHGPDISNHAEIYAALTRRGAAFCTKNAEELAAVILKLNRAAPPDIAQHAKQALADLRPISAEPATLYASIDELTDGKLSAALLD
jgi:3-deoxy-D-manno-octulosonic-acid transferase